MNHKHRIERLRRIAWNLFLIIGFLLCLIWLIHNPEPAQAAFVPCNITDGQIYSVYIPTGEEIDTIAKTVWGEARGSNDTESAAVVWCILNRVGGEDFRDTIKGVITQHDQFHGYKPYYPVTDEIQALTIDVVHRWIAEQFGDQDVGRVLPKEFKWFSGDGKHNYFRDSYRGGTRWSWILPTPYEN